jgi:hypothetical protein
MSIINFIIHLGIIFVIFGFIWGIFNYIISMFTSGSQKSNQSEYIAQIIKNIFLVGVTANFVSITGEHYISSPTFRIIISSFILGLYLLEKMQNRNKYAQFSNLGNGALKGLSTSFELKQERFLLIGSIVLFVFCLFFPMVVNNGVINWFNSAIEGLNDTFLIGFIFKIIAFFSVMSLVMRGSNIIGKLVTGQSLKSSFEKPENKNPFGGFSQFGGSQGAGQQKENSSQVDYDKKASANTDSEGFTEYEDVTDDA